MLIVMADNNKKNSKKSILDIKPRDWGDGTENASEEIDEILYS